MILGLLYSQMFHSFFITTFLNSLCAMKSIIALEVSHQFCSWLYISWIDQAVCCTDHQEECAAQWRSPWLPQILPEFSAEWSWACQVHVPVWGHPGGVCEVTGQTGTQQCSSQGEHPWTSSCSVDEIQILRQQICMFMPNHTCVWVINSDPFLYCVILFVISIFPPNYVTLLYDVDMPSCVNVKQFILMILIKGYGQNIFSI